MKKTYISPNTLIVEFSAKSAILQMSINSKEVDGANAGWVKEDNPTINDVNVWDEEW